MSPVESPQTALVVAHPGHELRLAAWIAKARPWLFIIAKGARSGRSQARIEASRAMSQTLGARPGDPFGADFDADIYERILCGDGGYFHRLTDQLREVFAGGRFRRVVTDGWQNYNPVHDLTHLMARVAAAEASSLIGRPIEVLDYPVVLGALAHADTGPESWRGELSTRNADAKLALAGRYPDIAEDVAALCQTVGRRAFDTETLHRPPALAALPPTSPPWYETYGESRVRAGIYDRVLRWSHMAPIVAALTARVEAAEKAGVAALVEP